MEQELAELKRENAEYKSVLDDFYIKKCYTCGTYTSRSLSCYFCGLHACKDCESIRRHNVANICQECAVLMCLSCKASKENCLCHS